MEQVVESSPKNVSKEVLEKLDYLIGDLARSGCREPLAHPEGD